jgi:hypothetical protein
MDIGENPKKVYGPLVYFLNRTYVLILLENFAGMKANTPTPLYSF